MQTTHAKRTKNKEVTDKKKEGRRLLLLSYKKVTTQCTRKKDNDSGVQWSVKHYNCLKKKTNLKELLGAGETGGT